MAATAAPARNGSAQRVPATFSLCSSRLQLQAPHRGRARGPPARIVWGGQVSDCSRSPGGRPAGRPLALTQKRRPGHFRHAGGGPIARTETGSLVPRGQASRERALFLALAPLSRPKAKVGPARPAGQTDSILAAFAVPAPSWRRGTPLEFAGGARSKGEGPPR